MNPDNKRFIIWASDKRTHDEVAMVLRRLPETLSINAYMIQKHGLSLVWVTKVPGMGYVLAKLRDDGKIREYSNNVVFSSM